MKHLKAILCLVLALCLVFSLGGCAKKSAVLGQWKATVEMADQIKQIIQSEDEESFLEGFELDSFAMELNAEFKEDGTYSIASDPASVENAMQSLKGALKEPIRKYYESLGWDVDAYGIDLDQVVDQIFEEASDDQFMEEMSFSGKYRLDGDKLYLSDSVDTAPDESSYAVLEIKDGTMSITDITGMDEEDEELRQVLPLVFTRVESGS